MSRKVLIIEDEEGIIHLLNLYLKDAGYDVIAAGDGVDGLALHARTCPDLVILDIMLPALDGFEVCRRIRAWSKTPILMLTARGDEDDRIQGLDLGADDYLVKPWADQAGYTEAWARAAYAKRADNGHPETAFVIGRTSYWWQDELTAWWERQKRAPIERTGDPDELLFAQGVADVLGYESPRTILAMKDRGQFAPPDAVASGEGQKSGQARPQWKRRTVWDWADNRGWVRK